MLFTSPLIFPTAWIKLLHPEAATIQLSKPSNFRLAKSASRPPTLGCLANGAKWNEIKN